MDSNIIKNVDCLLSVLKKGPEHISALKVAMLQGTGCKDHDFTIVKSYLKGNMLVDDSVMDMLSLTPEGIMAARIGIKDYEEKENAKAMIEYNYYMEAIKSFKSQRKVMLWTIVIGVGTILFNIFLAIWNYLESIKITAEGVN